MIMDITGMSMKEVSELGMLDYLAAGIYSWAAYTQRRVDLMMGKENPDNMGGHRTIDWTGINPVYQEIQKQKREREIPDKFNLFRKTGVMT